MGPDTDPPTRWTGKCEWAGPGTNTTSSISQQALAYSVARCPMGISDGRWLCGVDYPSYAYCVGVFNTEGPKARHAVGCPSFKMLMTTTRRSYAVHARKRRLMQRRHLPYWPQNAATDSRRPRRGTWAGWRRLAGLLRPGPSAVVMTNARRFRCPIRRTSSSRSKSRQRPTPTSKKAPQPARCIANIAAARGRRSTRRPNTSRSSHEAVRGREYQGRVAEEVV